jgi:hypothetical protein
VAFLGLLGFWTQLWETVLSRSGCAAVSCGGCVLLSFCDVTVCSVVCGLRAVFCVPVVGLTLRHRMSGKSFVKKLFSDSSVSVEQVHGFQLGPCVSV